VRADVRVADPVGLDVAPGHDRHAPQPMARRLVALDEVGDGAPREAPDARHATRDRAGVPLLSSPAAVEWLPRPGQCRVAELHDAVIEDPG
jgi:hypothetical protein